MFGKTANWIFLYLFLCSNFFVLISFCIEKYGFAKRILNQYFGLILIALNLTTAFVLPVILILRNDLNFIVAFFSYSFFSVILVFKLISYHMVNYWYRNPVESQSQDEWSKDNKSDLQHNHFFNILRCCHNKIVCYPNNLNLNDIYYFICAPTCCYEINYPRNQRIRIGFFIKNILEFVSCFLFSFIYL